MTPHVEKHFTAGETVRDVVIGMSDGLTVPFALAAGLTGAIAASSLVVTAGMAEVAAGCVAMGLGGYLAAKGDEQHYESEVVRERYEIAHFRDLELAETREVLSEFGVPESNLDSVVEAISSDEDRWVKFMMRFELGLEEPQPGRALRSAAAIGISYAVGGFVPLAPYFFIPKANQALPVSVAFTMVALLVFGYVKGHFAGASPWRSSIQTVLVGGIAAAVAFGVAKLIT